MSGQKPKFIFAFANDEDALLQLKKEEYDCWDELAPVQDEIEISRLGLATLEKIARVLNANHNNIQLFHYGGHAEKGKVLLIDAAVNAKILAELLGQEKNLKAVLLNGCGTKQMVDELLSQGVPVVVATHAPVSDDASIQFAKKFYNALAGGKTLGQAFNTAASLMQVKKPKLEVSRGIGLESGITENLWGIFYRDSSLLNWSIKASGIASGAEKIPSHSTSTADKIRPEGLGMSLSEPKFVEIEQIPYLYSNNQLFGRTDELAALDRAWEAPNVGIFSIIAEGGIGKSALIAGWLENMRQDNYRGAECILSTTFYNEGQGKRISNADSFIDQSIKQLDEQAFKDAAAAALSSWKKGELLADLLCKSKTLLILDGLEPLQESSNLNKGKIKDLGLYALIRELARRNEGLCLISSRVPISGFERFSTRMIICPLQVVSDEAGIAIVRSQRIRGTDEAILQAITRFRKNALAIKLLGSWCAGFRDLHIKNTDKIPAVASSAPFTRLNTESIIEALAKKLEIEGRQDEGMVLQVIGLFDRPVARELFKNIHSNFSDITQAFIHLAKLHLIQQVNPRPFRSEDSIETIDCHPIIRAYFAKEVKERAPDFWKSSHSQLFQHFKVQGAELPNTLEELDPLFRAVRHGCLAGFEQAALDQIYYKRIKRGDDNYVFRKLGAISSDLTVISYFFEQLWDKPLANLDPNDRLVLLSWAAFRLKSLGRFEEAVAPFSVGLQGRIKQRRWFNAAKNASNLSEVYLSIGQLDKALDYGQRSLQYADRSGDWGQKVTKRGVYATCLFLKGHIEKASTEFRRTEKEHYRHISNLTKYLISVNGFWYCELLLRAGKIEEVVARCKFTLNVIDDEKDHFSILDFALTRLALGKAHTYLYEIKGDENHSRHAKRLLQEALEGIHRSNHQDYIPAGLLALAAFYRITADFDSAQETLDELFDMCTNFNMKLFLCDYHIEYAYFHFARKDNRNACQQLSEAEELLAAIGYDLRKEEVRELLSRCTQQ